MFANLCTTLPIHVYRGFQFKVAGDLRMSRAAFWCRGESSSVTDWTKGVLYSCGESGALSYRAIGVFRGKERTCKH